MGPYVQASQAKYPTWYIALTQVSNLDARAKAIVAHEANAKALRQHTFLGNGDLGIVAEAHKANMLHAVLLVSLRILKFATVSDDADEAGAPRLFVHHPESQTRVTRRQHLFFFGYHADDCFGAYMAILYFQQRRRKPFGATQGQFKPNKEIAVFKVSDTDSRTMVQESLVDFSEQAALQQHGTALHRMAAQMGTLPEGRGPRGGVRGDAAAASRSPGRLKVQVLI